MTGVPNTPKNRLASFGREIDLEAAFRDARVLLNPPRELYGHKGPTVPNTQHAWELARAQWHYDYGNRALAERMLDDLNKLRRSYQHDGRKDMEPLEFRRVAV